MLARLQEWPSLDATAHAKDLEKVAGKAPSVARDWQSRSSHASVCVSPSLPPPPLALLPLARRRACTTQAAVHSGTCWAAPACVYAFSFAICALVPQRARVAASGVCFVRDDATRQQPQSPPLPPSLLPFPTHHPRCCPRGDGGDGGWLLGSCLHVCGWLLIRPRPWGGGSAGPPFHFPNLTDDSLDGVDMEAFLSVNHALRVLRGKLEEQGAAFEVGCCGHGWLGACAGPHTAPERVAWMGVPRRPSSPPPPPTPPNGPAGHRERCGADTGGAGPRRAAGRALSAPRAQGPPACAVRAPGPAHRRAPTLCPTCGHRFQLAASPTAPRLRARAAHV